MSQSGQETDLLIEEEQIQAQRNLEFEQELIVEREYRIKQIESDILDVNQLMRELGALVHEQGSQVGKFLLLVSFSGDTHHMDLLYQANQNH